MGMISQTQWSGLGFAPFSLPDWPSACAEGGTLYVTEWSTGQTPEESRISPRRTLQCAVIMTDTAWYEAENPLPVRGECLNVSDHGLYAVVPNGFGLAIGQQYLLQLLSPDPETDSEPRLGTIVRTERLLRDGADHLGIGIRFGTNSRF